MHSLDRFVLDQERRCDGYQVPVEWNSLLQVVRLWKPNEKNSGQSHENSNSFEYSQNSSARTLKIRKNCFGFLAGKHVGKRENNSVLARNSKQILLDLSSIYDFHYEFVGISFH